MILILTGISVKQNSIGSNSNAVSAIITPYEVETMRLKTSNPAECRKSLSKIVNLVVSGSLDPRAANCAIYGVNSILGAIRTCEQEQRLNELEAMLEELEHER